MRKLKLALVLPALFCGIEGMLWYWGLHSQRWVPSYQGGVSPADPIRTGLDFPAAVWASLTTTFLFDLLVPSNFEPPSRWGSFLSHLLVGTPVMVYFLLCVAGCWYLIGRLLDRRAAGEEQLKTGSLRNWRGIWQLLVLAFGVFTLLASLHIPIRSFIDTIEKALVQTWAAFLIGVPVSGLAHRLLKRGGHEQPTVPGRRARRPFSNFRLFVITMGVLAALLVLGVLTGPTIPK